MKTYIGTNLIKAEPMNRGDYNKYRGWPMPTDENPGDKGYLIKQDTGYETWQPKDVFEKEYHLAENMIVFKEDAIARKNADNTLTPYEVVCADENVFVIAPISLNADNSCTTDYEKLEAYSNDSTILTLEQMNFIKMEDK